VKLEQPAEIPPGQAIVVIDGAIIDKRDFFFYGSFLVPFLSMLRFLNLLGISITIMIFGGTRYKYSRYINWGAHQVLINTMLDGFSADAEVL